MKDSKFKAEDVYHCLCTMHSLPCEYGIISKHRGKKRIYFDGDTRGNGRGPYLELEFCLEYAKIRIGCSLIPEEKKLVFPYCDYDNIEDYSEHIADFVNNYFKSFKYVRIAKP